MKKFTLLLAALIVTVNAQWDPNYVPGRSVMVHLFEWPWSSIAKECENWLGPKGFGGVQISPPTENFIINSRPWWERYSPISYKFVTRSGNEAELQDMIRRCNNVGVRIYADMILNNMGRCDYCNSTGDSTCSYRNYYDIPYGPKDFHKYCDINDFNNPYQVRNCSFDGNPDLDQGSDYVHFKMTEMMNRLISFGVAGFRIHAPNFMWPKDLEVLFQGLNNLNVDHGFAENSEVFIYQEIIDLGAGPISKYEYTYIGRVTESRYSVDISRAFLGINSLNWLIFIIGSEVGGYVEDMYALIFVDSHDSQRGHNDLNYKTTKQYKMATAFTLAQTYGSVRIMSSYDFLNTDMGPPQDGSGNIIPPGFNPDGSCTNGWICEHRWPQMNNMVEFRTVVTGTNISNWWDNGNNQIAFCRGDKGFIAWNNENYDMNVNLQTCLPAGTYCDVISGSKSGNSCTGKIVTVASDGTADIVINWNEDDGVLAIHENSKIYTF